MIHLMHGRGVLASQFSVSVTWLDRKSEIVYYSFKSRLLPITSFSVRCFVSVRLSGHTDELK